MERPNATQPPRRADRPDPDLVPLADSVAASIRAGPGRLGDAQRCTVAEEALELAQWLGDGQGILARLQELYEKEPTSNQFLVGRLIREAVEHFGRMPW